MNSRTALSLTLLLHIALCCLARPAETGTRLWLLRAGEIAEYDASSWAVKNTVRIPREIAKDAENLQINHAGEMLFCQNPDIQFGDPDQHFARDKVWLWDGQTASLLDRRLTHKSVPAGRGSVAVVERSPRLSLSSDAGKLYWFENEFNKLTNEDGGELSVSTTFRVWQTDFTGGNPSPVATSSFPPCQCETGACSETCPEAGFWFPEGGTGDFFIVNDWIPGQLSATYQASFLYRESGGKWSGHKRTQALEEVLDAAQGGNIIIHALRDGGCCGWENEGDDQTLLASGGKDTVLFDERQRYSNPNYDVSFYTSKAKRSPDGSFIALNMVSTALPGAEIRLSDAGRQNPGELARIRQSIAVLPAVEVLRAADPRRHIVSLPHAAFAGWLNDRELLIIENGMLVAFDVTTSGRRNSAIKVSNESHVFVR